MNTFLPNQLLEEILREYLIIHWTDKFSDQNDYPHKQLRTQGGDAFRSAEFTEQHTIQVRDLLIKQYPERESNILNSLVYLQKLHDGNFISDTSQSQFLISLTRNNVLWYNTFKESYLSLPYNEAVDVRGITLSLPQLVDNSYYYIEVFEPENA
jgi:hypothetical protein